MNIGIRLHDTAPGSFEERLRFAKAQGFSCVHVALSKTVPGFSMTEAPKRLADPAFAERVRTALEETQLQCAVLGCYLSLVSPDPQKVAQTQEIYKAHLRFSTKIGAAVVGTEAPAGENAVFATPYTESEEALNCFIESLRPLVRCAEEENAVIAIEPVYRHIVSTPERMQRVLEAVPSDHLQVILDAVNLIGPSRVHEADAIIDDAIARLGDRVRVLHMKDFRLSDDGSEVLSMACGLGHMHYEHLLRFGAELPMTLEDTRPENAEASRLLLERIGGELSRV